jgi:hypothetical protein
VLFLGWSWTESTITEDTQWPVVPAPDDDESWWVWSNKWNAWQGKPKLKYLKKTCPSDVLFTTNPTWPGPCWNQVRRGWKLATNRLNYGTDFLCSQVLINFTLLIYFDNSLPKETFSLFGQNLACFIAEVFVCHMIVSIPEKSTNSRRTLGKSITPYISPVETIQGNWDHNIQTPIQLIP